MNDIFVAVHVHGYQPSKNPQELVDRIYHESYERLVRFVEDNRHAFFSFDIAKMLGERLPKEFLERLNALVREQRLEPVNTAASHYLLSHLPPGVIKRQLSLNLEFYRSSFAPSDPIPGVFLPELAYIPSLPRILYELGYSWLLTDDGPLVLKDNVVPVYARVPQNFVFTIDNCGVLLRSHEWSDIISWNNYPDGASFAKELLRGQEAWRKKCFNYKDSYVILALDWETFGHHPPGDQIERFVKPFFDEIASHQDICQLASFDFIFSHFTKIETPKLTLPSGCWTTKHLSIPFPNWNHPQNPYHRAWNEFMRLSFESTPENPSCELQKLLDTAFVSCSPWWAAKTDPGERKNAGWYLPDFQKIIELLPDTTDKLQLWKLYKTMEEFAHFA